MCTEPIGTAIHINRYFNCKFRSVLTDLEFEDHFFRIVLIALFNDESSSNA